MFALALSIELRFPQCQSLKHKRKLRKPIIDGVRQRFDVSVAEVAHQDSWQRCELGVALVSGDIAVAEQLADDIERFIWQAAETEVLAIERHWMEIER